MAEDKMDFEPSQEDLQILREWITQSPHIIQDYDDEVLSAFVRGCKGSLQKTKKVIESFNALGQRYPEIFKNYDPLDQRLVDHITEFMMFVLPKKTPDGCNVLMSLVRNENGYKNDPYKCNGLDYHRYWLLSLYSFLWRNVFGSGKWILVSDCKGSTFAHSRDCTPVSLKHGMEIMQNAFPVRLQAVHILNIPPFLEYLLNIGKSFAKKKLANRMYFHSTMETFYEQFPKEILPKEYGGSEESALTLNERWFKTVQSYREKLLEEESKMRRLDPLRPKTDDAEEMVGTFKTLNVD